MANGPGRDRKRGLDYYPWMITAYDNDPDLFDLIEEYGPLGDAVYRRCLDMIYANGYYMEIDIEKLARKLIGKIGNKWTKGVHQIVCILRYCSELGLFESSLAEQGIWTSFGIQKNYLFVAGRRKIYDTKYLIDRDIPLSASNCDISVTENAISATENMIDDVEMTPKNIKVNDTKENKDLCAQFESDDAFLSFWEKYPKKVDKKKACQKFIKVCKSETVYNELMVGLEKHKKSKQWQDMQYIPHPTTWLNGERWNDEVNDSLFNNNSNILMRELPEWYTNQDSVVVDTSDYDEKILEEKIKRLREESNNEKYTSGFK